MASSPASEIPGKRGYPLGTLFVLITICAVLTAGLSPTIRAVAADKLKWWDPLFAAGVGSVVLALIGFCAGGLYYPHWRGLLCGGMAGVFVGLVAGPLTLVESRDLVPVTLAMTVGSIIAIAIAAVMRRKGD
ncbi:MAG: hypothetical protein K8R36_25240 [Planctomycetales bacterium]|nr:hypothetical protein [Planctomycetales bacterium]